MLDGDEVFQRPLVRPDGPLTAVLVLEDRLDVDHAEVLIRDPLRYVLGRGDGLDQLMDDRAGHGDRTDQRHVCPLVHGEDRVNDRGQTLPHLVLAVVGFVRLDVVQDDQVGPSVHRVNETQDLRVEARRGERELRLTVEHLLGVGHVAAARALGGGTELREVLP